MKRFIPFVIIAVFIGCIAWFVLALRVSPINPNEPITVRNDGEAYQGNNRVGLATNQDGQKLNLLLISPQTTDGDFLGQITLNFENSDAEDFISPRFVSIQSTSEMDAVWADASTLTLFMPELSPESYTQISLVGNPSNAFQLNLAERLASSLTATSIITWLIIGLLLIILTFIWGLQRIYHEKWPVVSNDSPHPPQGIQLLDAAILHHGSITAIDLIALLYSLAGRGYVQIVSHSDKEVSFLRTNKQDDLAQNERNFLLILFPTENIHSQMSEVLAKLDHELFSAVVGQLYIDTYNNFTERHFFRENPRTMHLRYKTIAILVQVLGLCLSFVGYFFFFHSVPGLLFLGIGIYLSGCVMFAVSYHFRPFSETGRQVMYECSRFRSYLAKPMPIGLEGENGYLFYVYLPFSLVFDCVTSWQNRFATMRMYVPDWYFNQAELTLLSEKFMDQTRELAHLLAIAMVAVKDPNVD